MCRDSREARRHKKNAAVEHGGITVSAKELTKWQVDLAHCARLQTLLVSRCCAAALGKANEREMPERRHRPAFDQLDVPGLRRPAGIALERKFGAPAELARRRREPLLERAAETRFRADAAHQD